MLKNSAKQKILKHCIFHCRMLHLYFPLQNVAFGLFTLRSIFDFFKIFELSSGSSLSSFLESNTRTLSSGRFVNKDKQLERFFLVLALAKYGKLPPELNTLDCLKEPQTNSIYCFYFLHNYVVM